MLSARLGTTNFCLGFVIIFNLIILSQGRPNATQALIIRSLNETGLDEDQHIVFPGGTNEHQMHTILARMSTKGKRNCEFNICEEVDDYPADVITAVITKAKVYDEYFKSSAPQFDITDRGQFPDDDDRNLCDAELKTVFPRTMKNVKKEDKLVVNVDKYQQLLVYEVCKSGGTCQFSDLFPNDYEVSCKQRFVTRRFMAIKDDEKPALDLFEVPSCCVCTYRRK